MFGGYWLNPYNEYFFNDLWEYNIATNQWTWIGGNNVGNKPGNYGTKGVPDTANLPPSRLCNCSWKDSVGNFFMFGGSQNHAPPSYNANDLWSYNPITKEWTWLIG